MCPQRGAVSLHGQLAGERRKYVAFFALSLAGAFYPEDVRLTYAEYREYLKQCDDFAREHPGYTCRRDTNPPFRNIQITMLEGSRVIVTKDKCPAIHFVIQHPKMCAAIENMVLPVVEPFTEERSARP